MFENVKPGDLVALVVFYTLDTRLECARVCRVTPTMLELEGFGYKFRRSDGRKVGRRTRGMTPNPYVEPWSEEHSQKLRRQSESDALGTKRRWLIRFAWGVLTRKQVDAVLTALHDQGISIEPFKLKEHEVSDEK